ncbi:hypothetical protein [Jiella sp. M17.18]|uniref:hypothetical protein n=1 Tax=Jiella sp. M17.18 TaxID=3234247 RepID=UPI0034DF3F03
MEAEAERPVPTKLTEAAREQVKLRANWLNGLSVATFAVGTLSSTTRAVLDPVPTFTSFIGSFAVGVICFSISWVLHIRAAAKLRELDR